MSEEGLGPKLVRPIVRFVGAAGVGGILLQDAMIRWYWIKLVLLGFIWIAGTDWALDKGPIGIWRDKHARLALGLIGLTTLPILWGGYLLYRGDAYNEPAAYIHIHPPAAIPAYTYFGPGKSLGFSVKGWKEGPGKLKSRMLARMYLIQARSVGATPAAFEAKARSLFEADSLRREYSRGRGPEGSEKVTEDGTEISMWTPPLNNDLCEGMMRQTVRLYFFAWADWKDIKGNRESLLRCGWLDFKPDSIGQYSESDFSWNDCGQ